MAVSNDDSVPLLGAPTTVTEVIGVVPRSSLVSTLPETDVSSFVVAVSFTGSGARSMLILVIAVLELTVPSLTVTLTMRCVVEGVSVVLSKPMAWIAAAYCALVAMPVSVTVLPLIT